jgi:hypothetical protein
MSNCKWRQFGPIQLTFFILFHLISIFQSTINEFFQFGIAGFEIQEQNDEEEEEMAKRHQLFTKPPVSHRIHKNLEHSHRLFIGPIIRAKPKCKSLSSSHFPRAQFRSGYSVNGFEWANNCPVGTMNMNGPMEFC